MGKIVSKEEYRDRIYHALKRDHKRVALCHGVFDLVHPGHVIHLNQAKEMADVLVVSSKKRTVGAHGYIHIASLDPQVIINFCPKSMYGYQGSGARGRLSCAVRTRRASYRFRLKHTKQMGITYYAREFPGYPRVKQMKWV